MTYPTYTRQFFIENGRVQCVIGYGDERMYTQWWPTRAQANNEATRLIVWHQGQRKERDDDVPF